MGWDPMPTPRRYQMWLGATWVLCRRSPRIEHRAGARYPRRTSASVSRAVIALLTVDHIVADSVQKS